MAKGPPDGRGDSRIIASGQGTTKKGGSGLAAAAL
jgi:hypothetical protein